jgi:hypothetical protein
MCKHTEHAGALHEGKGPRPNTFPCQATPVAGSCRVDPHPVRASVQQLAPAIPRYSAMPPCVDRDTRDANTVAQFLPRLKAQVSLRSIL